MTVSRDQPKARKPTRDAEGSIFKKQVSRRTSAGKSRTLTVFVVRCRYTDATGRRREKKAQVDSYELAKATRRSLRGEIENELKGRSVSKEIKVFGELLDYFNLTYVKEAEFIGDEKVGGLREPLTHARRHVQLFRDHFGRQALRAITYDDLLDFKTARLATPVEIEHKVTTIGAAGKTQVSREIRSRPRAVASVNRELERLRRILNIALHRGWIDQNPFAQGDALISQASEEWRVRILEPDEEKRLMLACRGRREHLRGIVTIAIDTFLRKNELFTLTPADINLERRTITVRKLNSKTLRPRMVPISRRALPYLEALVAMCQSPTDLVFGIASVKRSFSGALRDARINDFHFHDLRGTGITRLLRAGMPAAEVMKISGHTQWKTFMRYVKQDEARMIEASEYLDKWHSDNLP